LGYPYPPPNNNESLSPSLPYPPPVSNTPTPQAISPTPTTIPEKSILVGEKIYPCGKDKPELLLIDTAVKWIGTIQKLPVADYFLSSSLFFQQWNWINAFYQ
jgi:hypothetical protein